MIRIKKGKNNHKYHKKILKLCKGYYGARSRCFRIANQAFIKSGQYSYRDRKQKKRYFRKIWIMQINAKVREYGMSYNYFINKLKKKSIYINRKILSNLINNNSEIFEKLMLTIKNNKI